MSPQNEKYPLLPAIRTAEGDLTECALLLEGGSLRSIYSAGVCDVLMEHGIHPGVIAGVSAGSLCGWNMMARQIGRFAHIGIFHRHDSRYAGLQAIASDGGLVGFRFLLETVEELYPCPTGMREEPGRRFIAVATDCKSGEPFYAERGVFTPFEKALQASSSLAFSSRMVHEQGKALMDGGYSVSVPLEWAQKEGIEKKVVILTRPVTARKSPVSDAKRRAFAAAYSRYPGFLDAVNAVPENYNRLREEIQRQRDAGELFLIAPAEDLPMEKMEGNTDKLYLCYLLGRRDALQALPRLKEYLKA